MKVDSAYRYILPCNVLLEKGVSEVGEIPAAAQKHLDKLIAAGIVKVLDAPKASPAPDVKADVVVTLPAQVQSVSVKAHVAVDESAAPAVPAPKPTPAETLKVQASPRLDNEVSKAPAPVDTADPVDVSAKRRKKE